VTVRRYFICVGRSQEALQGCSPLLVLVERDGARRKVERKRFTTDRSRRGRSPLASAPPRVGGLLRLVTEAGLEIVFILLAWWRCFGCWNFTVFSWWSHAASPVLIKDQHGGAPLQPGVSSLAGPIPVTRLPKGNVTIGIIFAQRMFLAASNILRPVAGVSLLVVEQSTNTELLCGGSVPAGPVASAGGLVPEYSVQPVTVLRALGGISSFSLIAVHVVRIVAGTQQAEGSSSVVHQAVGTGLDEALVAIAFVVEVTLALVSCSLHPGPATLGSTGAQATTPRSSWVAFEIVRVGISLGDNWGPSVPGRVQGRQGDQGGSVSV